MARGMGKSSLSALVSVVALSGCASVTSKVETAGSAASDGLVYYMPRKPVKVTISVDSAGVQTPSVDTIDASADTSRRFVLDYEKNLVGKNHLAMGVTSDGLLTSSNADTTSGIIAIVQNLGKAIGAAQAMVAAAAPVIGAPPPVTCPKSSTNVVLIYPEVTTKAARCGYTIELHDLSGGDVVSHVHENSTRASKTSSHQAGIFYKADLPYLVQVKDANNQIVTSAIAFSPDLSPIAFVPVTRTLFSDNHTNITLSRGTVTSVDEQSDGELIALTELPADFISAYAGALGQLFSAFGTDNQSKATLLADKNALAVASMKHQACSLALKASSATLDPRNLVGKTPAEQAAAVSSIDSALQSLQETCS